MHRMQREEKLQIAVKSVDFYTLSVIYSSLVNELHKPAGLQPQKGLCIVRDLFALLRGNENVRLIHEKIFYL